MAEHVHTTPPAPLYRLAQHPTRSDHLAIMQPDGTVASTMAIDATRAEIAGKLAAQGLVLHDDDTIVQAEPGTTRRGLLTTLTAGIAGAAVLPIATTSAVAAEHPDAELIARADEFCRLEAVIDRTCWAIDDCDKRTENRAAALAEHKAAEDRQDELTSLIIEAVPVTLVGYAAKTRAAAAWYGGRFDERGHGGAILWSIVQHLVPSASGEGMAA